MAERGKFWVVEGPDGVGKSTQARLLATRLRNLGHGVVEVHEPGATPIGQELRQVLLNVNLGRTALTSLLLFTAARVELWQQSVRPALEAGQHVVADRHWLSSAAYQGHGERLGIPFVQDLTSLALPQEYVHPTMTALLLLPGGVRDSRIDERGASKADTFESRGPQFMSEVAQGYIIAATKLPEVVGIDASGTPEEVSELVWGEVTRVLAEQG